MRKAPGCWLPGAVRVRCELVEPSVQGGCFSPPTYSYTTIAAMESAILGFPISPADVAAQAADEPFQAIVAEMDGRLGYRLDQGIYRLVKPFAARQQA